MGPSITPPIICPTLVGRADYLATLRLLVEQAKQGAGRVALIGGEAGIGKSRLVAEARTYAMAQGFLPLQGNCFPTDAAYPYAPLLDLLRSLLASGPPAALAAAVEALARDIAPLLPELSPEQAHALPQLDPEQEKRRIYAFLAGFFLNLSAQSPLLLIVEDVHWSDDTSLDFLHYLVRRAASHPLLLLITYRDDEVHPPLRAWLAQINRERLAQEMQLVPLSRGDLDTMLSAIFEQRHTAFDMRRFLHGELLDMLSTLTEGNPFFVEETISSLIAAGDIFFVQGYWNRRSRGEISIPRSVQDAVQRRTEHLGEAARYVLRLAAVAGRQFDFALLQQLTQYDEERLLLIMKELVSAQLVLEESADRFAFRHALTRQAIYTQLLARERAMLHRTIAETMERQPSTTPDAHLEDLAYHFYQARAWQKTKEYAQRAGEKALQLYSHRAAIGYFTWALEALDHLGHPLAPTLYLARGQAHETLGEFEQAQRDYTQALHAARTTNERTAEWQSAIALGFLWAERNYAQTERWFRQAFDLAQALDDPLLQARSLNRIGNWHLNVEQPQEALRYHREALALFEHLHDSRGIAETLDLLGMTSYLSGDIPGGTDYYRQAVTLFREFGDQAGLTSSLATLPMRAPTFQSDLLLSTSSLAEALQDAEEAVLIAREIGHRSAEAYALFQLGLCLGSQGEYGRALATARQSLGIAEEIEHRQWQTAAHTVLGGIYSGLFAYPEARDHFEQALAMARESGSLFWTRMATGYLAWLMILMNEPGEAQRILDAVLSPDTPAETMAQALLWRASIELALAQGEATRAIEILDRLAAAQGQSSLGILKLRGEALVMLRRPLEAEAAFEAALAMARTQGARPMQWRIAFALGMLYRARGSQAESEQAYASARALLEELAATIADELLREGFLRQAIAMLPHASPLPPERLAKQAYGGLTAREREIAILIAQGKSNQAIADVLVVTKRTVETHIGNIMFKLGRNSRTQIAVWAVEAGLVSKAE